MRLVLLTLLLSTLACASPPPAAPIPPATPPPPPPEREALATTVTGAVVSSDGIRVPHALVQVRPTDVTCVPLASAIGASSDDNGEFSVTVEGPVGPAYHGCVVVEAQSGGAHGSVTVPAWYTSSRIDRVTARAEVRLLQPEVLSSAEAERLARRLTQAINEPASDAAGELALYVNGGGEALRVATEHYRLVLGSVVAIREVAPEEWYRNSPHHSFELRGSTGRTSRLNVHQEALTRLHSLLLDYGMRTERFMQAYVRAVSSGDAERLARILNPDDVDFPVERARAMIISYRERYDTATLRPQLVAVDETRGRFTWRIIGRTPSGAEASETIELQTGDGLVGVIGL